MDDYMNKPENMDTAEVEPVKRKQTSKTRKKTEKNTTENFPAKEMLYENQKPKTFIDSNIAPSIPKTCFRLHGTLPAGSGTCHRTSGNHSRHNHAIIPAFSN